jgi:hypothetical protein
MNIVLDAHATPTWPVDTGLDRHDGPRTERCFHGFREARSFVDLEAESVTETVSEGVAEATVLNVASSQTIGILPFHSCTHRFGRNGVRVLHDIVDRALVA